MKAMVLLSGGVDSATCLALAVQEYGKDEVIALSMHYGQKHEREIESARRIAAYYSVRQLEMDLSSLFAYSGCSLLSHTKEELPQKSYAEQLKHTDGKPVSTYVPFRNGLFLSAAAAVALSFGCTEIYYGAHADDAAGNAYPDCSQAFVDAMDHAIFLGSGNALRIKAPFAKKNKAQVVKTGLALGVPYELTWSCYAGEERPCGVCGTCIDRAAAFAANGVVDPALGVQEGGIKDEK